MSEWITVVVSALIGVAGAFILMYVRDIYLYDKKFRREIRRDLVEKRLEKLYSPLYRNIKSSEVLLNKSMISYGKGSKEEGDGREKTYLDQLVEQNFYLASEELQPFLAQLHGVGFYRIEDKDINNKMVELIINEYNELRDEYFDCM